MSLQKRNAFYGNDAVQILIDEDGRHEWFWLGKQIAFADIPPEIQGKLDDYLDSFELGNNTFDGSYEIHEWGDFAIRRKAELDPSDD